VIEVVPGFLAVRLAGLRTVRDLGGVDVEEADAELGLVAGDGRDGVAVGDALDGGDEETGGRCEDGREEAPQDADEKGQDKTSGHAEIPSKPRKASVRSNSNVVRVSCRRSDACEW
jgi:hypothetical protein